jgi:hypothetical protein
LDKHRAALQIRAVLVMFHGEARRSDPKTVRDMTSRARELLDEVEGAVQPFPELRAELARARQQVEAGGSLPGRDLGQESVDGGDQIVDTERLR